MIFVFKSQVVSNECTFLFAFEIARKVREVSTFNNILSKQNYLIYPLFIMPIINNFSQAICTSNNLGKTYIFINYIIILAYNCSTDQLQEQVTILPIIIPSQVSNWFKVNVLNESDMLCVNIINFHLQCPPYILMHI